MRRTLFAMLVALSLIFQAGAALATPPADVTIEVEEFFEAPGDFLASGPVVDDGSMCNSGTTEDLFARPSGQGPWGFNLQVFKRFICDDGSGDFTVKLQVRVLFSGPEFSTFNWVVTDGTGDYANLHGAGHGVGLPPSGDYDIFDVYTGGLHID